MARSLEIYSHNNILYSMYMRMLLLSLILSQ